MREADRDARQRRQAWRAVFGVRESSCRFRARESRRGAAGLSGRGRCSLPRSSGRSTRRRQQERSLGSHSAAAVLDCGRLCSRARRVTWRGLRNRRSSGLGASDSGLRRRSDALHLHQRFGRRALHEQDIEDDLGLRRACDPVEAVVQDLKDQLDLFELAQRGDLLRALSTPPAKARGVPTTERRSWPGSLRAGTRSGCGSARAGHARADRPGRQRERLERLASRKYPARIPSTVCPSMRPIALACDSTVIFAPENAIT